LKRKKSIFVNMKFFLLVPIWLFLTFMMDLSQTDSILFCLTSIFQIETCYIHYKMETWLEWLQIFDQNLKCQGDFILELLPKQDWTIIWNHFFVLYFFSCFKAISIKSRSSSSSISERQHFEFSKSSGDENQS
jgi:hypothetical protein